MVNFNLPKSSNFTTILVVKKTLKVYIKRCLLNVLVSTILNVAFYKNTIFIKPNLKSVKAAHISICIIKLLKRVFYRLLILTSPDTVDSTRLREYTMLKVVIHYRLIVFHDICS